MIISTPDPEDAVGAVADLYRGDFDDDGFVFSHTRAMAVNMAALDAFESLVHAIVPSIGVRTYELATLAAAAAIGSPHCLLAHARKALRAHVLDEDQVRAIAAGDFDGFDGPDAAVLQFAWRMSTDAAGMTDDDSLLLRQAGFDDRQILDIALATGARNHFSRTLRALAVPVEDEVTGLSPQLRRVLAATAP